MGKIIFVFLLILSIKEPLINRMLKNTMSVNPFDCALSLTVEPSLQKKLLVIIPHLFGMILILFVETIPSYLSVAFVLMIFASLSYYYQLHITKKNKHSVYKLSQDSEKHWYLHFQNDRKIEGLLLNFSFVSRIIIILNYTDINNNAYVVVFTPDSLSANEFRHLIVRVNKT